MNVWKYFFPFLLLGCCSVTWGDTIRMIPATGEDNDEVSLSGTIREISTDEISMNDDDGNFKTIQTNTILWIQFDDEPIDLPAIRTMIQISQYEEAQAKLNAISDADLKKAQPFVVQDVEFLRAYTTTQLALSGTGALDSAGRQLVAFIKNYPESYHFYEANQLIGAVLQSMGKYSDAAVYYNKLTAAPWANTTLTAMVALGNIRIEEKKWDDAKAEFNQVLNFNDESSPLIETQKQFAKIGLGRVATLENDYDHAEQLFQEVIRSTNAENADILAQLYNAMGENYMAAGKNKEAIIAFLHVDLLYSKSRPEHVRALRQLYALWKQTQREDRAAIVKRTLKERYGIEL